MDLLHFIMFQFILTAGISILGALLLPVIIPILIPKYTEGILAAQWMIYQ